MIATILIVDDHVLNREFLLTLLGYGGYTLIEAADGAAGLEIAQRERPDLIIADILMPNMNGYQFVIQLRSDPSTAGIPVIFYTATFREQEAMAMAEACGVRWVLSKPSEPDLILQTVREALRRPGEAPSAPLIATAADGKALATIERHLSDYIDDIETSTDKLSAIVQNGHAPRHPELEGLTRRLSRSLSSLQAVSLRLSAMIDLGIELAAERDPHGLMEVACRAVQHICVARYAVLGILDDEGKRVEQIVTRGLERDEQVQADKMTVDRGLLHGLLNDSNPRRLNNPGGSAATLGLPEGHPAVSSLLGTGIMLNDLPRGFVYLVDKLGVEEFNEVDLRSTATIAAQFSVAYQNLDLFEKVRKQHEQLRVEMGEREKYRARIQYLANHDALTGLANRNLLGDRVTQAMRQARRIDRMLALLFLDLNRFKEINDSFGHGCGDAVLKAAAERLCSVVRAEDTVARHGGDEFIILLTGLKDLLDVVQIANKIIDTFSEPLLIDGHRIFTTASIGAAVFPDDSEDLQTLLQFADTAMYRAKAESSAFRFYSRDMSVRALERAALEHALRLAIEREEFELFYQPKVSLNTGRICGAEALIRWHHPERGLISPLDFIPLAEETGLIVQIGEWVWRAACFQNKAWQTAGLPPVSVAVNLSARQFRNPQLVDALTGALEQAGLDARYLELELTESLVMNSAEQFIEKLDNLKALGIRLTIDDFGTGYSSLSYLKRFPIDSVKIDQSFVRDIITDPDDAAITRSVISLGHCLNLEVVAEGVETEEQMAYLQLHECDQMQGFFFSEPVPAQDFARVLRQR